MHKKIKTRLGNIAVQIKEVTGTVPVIFLHGIYFDHRLWDYQVNNIAKKHTTITLDMPLHGESNANIKENWTLMDCAYMLIEVLDALEIEKVVAIGHSWGSMTILRAASKYSERFRAIGFCNMPLDRGTKGTKIKFQFQHLMLIFRNFYTRQVAKVMFGKSSRKESQQWLTYLRQTMGRMRIKDIKTSDYSVILRADDAHNKLQNLKVPALALKGMEDYVASPAFIALSKVKGGHASPLEAPDEVLKFITQVIAL